MAKKKWSGRTKPVTKPSFTCNTEVQKGNFNALIIECKNPRPEIHGQGMQAGKSQKTLVRCQIQKPGATKRGWVFWPGIARKEKKRGKSRDKKRKKPALKHEGESWPNERSRKNRLAKRKGNVVTPK